MENIYNLSIILSFAGLWTTSLFSGRFEVLSGFILIFSFGILHGSNDIFIIDSISHPKPNTSFIRIIAIYLFTVFLAAVVFYLVPVLALLLFVLFSAFHFGEQHWEYKKLNLVSHLKNVFYFSYGLFILQLLFVLNPQDVIEIVGAITSFEIHESVILISFISSALVFLFLCTYLFLKLNSFKSLIVQELFYLLVFAVIFKVSTLIWGFTIYFIFWHSFPSIFDQVKFIHGKFDKSTLFKYCKNAFPYWLTSLIGIFITYILFKNEIVFNALFFSFIAAITFPHAIIINKMFNNKEAQSNS